MNTNLTRTQAEQLLLSTTNTLIREGFELYESRKIDERFLNGWQVFLRKGDIDLDITMLENVHPGYEWVVEAYRRDCDYDVCFITDRQEIPDVVEYCLLPHYEEDYDDEEDF